MITSRKLLQRSFVGRTSATTTTMMLPSSSSSSLLLPSCHHRHPAAAAAEARMLPPTRSFVSTTNDNNANSSPPSSSVSSEEVSKFSKMAQQNTWWDPEQHPLVTMNPIRMKYIVDTLQELGHTTTNNNNTPFQSLTMLDCGCGGGLLSESLARLGADRVVAIDPSVELVEAAKEHASAAQSCDDSASMDRIDYRGGTTIEELAAAAAAAQSTTSSDSSQLFDVICCLEVIEHVDNVDSLLRAASSLLKDDGVLFLSTINKTWKSHVLAIVGAEYVMGYIPVGTHDWNQFRSPEQVKRLCAKAGLEQVHVTGMTMVVPPLDGKWRWRLDPNDLDVNWIGAYRLQKKAQGM
jgi:2-polyprenyl-6-hydroxyphenyl methylase/3-demethylubiquinone-9 3-methyltransferase